VAREALLTVLVDIYPTRLVWALPGIFWEQRAELLRHGHMPRTRILWAKFDLLWPFAMMAKLSLKMTSYTNVAKIVAGTLTKIAMGA
jgi:hypothetical protein